ncbi:MAG TPA: hypothetical protein VFS44_07230 [Gemmatimonadaceae bacterium]|nr:hypothetical protein [Gemmatimonadaceae bacterium]
MPATQGNLRKVRLNGQADTSASTFELPHGLTHYPAHSAVGNNNNNNNNNGASAELKKLHRQSYNRGQLEMMSKAVQYYESNFELQELLGNGGYIDDEFAVVGPEFLFHGTPVDWDTIYASGGIRANGTNPNVNAHVLSSSASGSGYVSGTRVLSVAKSFAKSDDGWVYLIYAPQGIAVFSTSPHTQAEVAALSMVPLTDIFMFKQLSDPNLIYINLGFRSALKNQQNLDRCLRLLGGGTYPQGLFWANVP